MRNKLGIKRVTGIPHTFMLGIPNDEGKIELKILLMKLAGNGLISQTYKQLSFNIINNYFPLEVKEPWMNAWRDWMQELIWI